MEYKDKLLYALLGKITNSNHGHRISNEILDIFFEEFDIDIESNNLFSGGILFQSYKPKITGRLIGQAFKAPPTQSSYALTTFIKEASELQATAPIVYECDSIKCGLIRAQLGNNLYFKELLPTLKVFDRANFAILGNILYEKFKEYIDATSTHS